MLDARVKELNVLFHQLDDSLNTEQAKFLRIVSDFTLGRIVQVDERIREVIEERTRREGVVASEVSSIKALWKELEVSDECKAQVPYPPAVHTSAEHRLLAVKLFGLQKSSVCRYLSLRAAFSVVSQKIDPKSCPTIQLAGSSNNSAPSRLLAGRC